EAEALEAFLAVAARGRGRAFDSHCVACGVAADAELGVDDRLVAAVLQRAADQLLIMAGAVAHRSVEKIDAGIERAVNGGDALLIVGGAIEAGHGHAAEADG